MIRLSEAIREGCKYGPQLFGNLLDGRGGSCAWGSVAIVLNEKTWHEAVMSTYKWAFYHPAECPAKEPHLHNSTRVSGMIVHLNNDHRWSREAISEWVETVERKLGLWDEPTVVSPVALVESESKEAEAVYAIVKMVKP